MVWTDRIFVASHLLALCGLDGPARACCPTGMTAKKATIVERNVSMIGSSRVYGSRVEDRDQWGAALAHLEPAAGDRDHGKSDCLVAKDKITGPGAAATVEEGGIARLNG